MLLNLMCYGLFICVFFFLFVCFEHSTQNRNHTMQHTKIVRTLIGAIEMPEAMLHMNVNELCKKMKPFEIKFHSKVSKGESFYQCVFAKVETTPELITCNQIARKLFDRFEDPPYLPHLSMMYGDSKKNRMTEEKKDKACQHMNDRLDFKEFNFVCDRIEIWQTDPKQRASNWDVIKSVPFCNM